jgi:endonuclease I
MYMVFYYDFLLHGMGPAMIKWHLEDPPDEWECDRNDLIEQLQGTRNPFIGDC